MRVLSIALAMSLVAGVAYANPVGEWRVQDGTADVKISKCGSALCGAISRASDPSGKDAKNPDPSKRNRSVIGLKILIDMAPTADNAWAGTIYNAEDGQNYTGRISLDAEGRLKIRGCVPGGNLCGDETWSRLR